MMKCSQEWKNVFSHLLKKAKLLSQVKSMIYVIQTTKAWFQTENVVSKKKKTHATCIISFSFHTILPSARRFNSSRSSLFVSSFTYQIHLHIFFFYTYIYIHFFFFFSLIVFIHNKKSTCPFVYHLKFLSLSLF
jgi:hypothetical protein